MWLHQCIAPHKKNAQPCGKLRWETWEIERNDEKTNEFCTFRIWRKSQIDPRRLHSCLRTNKALEQKGCNQKKNQHPNRTMWSFWQQQDVQWDIQPNPRVTWLHELQDYYGRRWIWRFQLLLQPGSLVASCCFMGEKYLAEVDHQNLETWEDFE